jgi:UDP-N-acetylglucosamine enolpyruvyl transferase
VHGVDLIERGYEGFLDKLDELGAHVEALVGSPA